MTKTILCADDSATMQKVAEITFAASEYTYVGARTADEALKLAKGDKPALVLADALMPGKTGYDLCKAIKSDPELAGVPVLLMCGNSQAYDAAKGEASGADGHVVKPWDTQVMLDKVAEVLGRGASAVAPAAAKTSTPNPAVARTPAGTPKPPPMVVPSPGAGSKPNSSVPQPPRSATIMGMPTFQLPPQGVAGPGAGAGAPPPAGTNGGATAPTPPPARPAPVSAAPSAPQNAGGSDGAGRPPMIKGEPRRGLRLVPIQEVAAQVASEHGLDPVGPEMQALVKLSREVVERIVWEVVPDLAEAIIRQNLDKLTARAR